MLTVRLPRTYAAEREYAVRVVLEELLGLDVALQIEDRGDTAIEDGARTLRISDGLFATAADDWLTERSLPVTPLAHVDAPDGHPERSIPVLYGTPAWERDGDVVELGVDVFGGAFFLLTRYEELVRPDRDAHERFPAAANVAVRAGVARRPLVDEYVELLWLLLRALWPSLQRRERQPRFVPSHDVDWPLTGDRTTARMLRRATDDVMRARDPATAARRLRAHLRAADRDLDVNNTFDAIMDASERAGVRSTFFFITGRRSPLDGEYSIDDPWIRALLRRIHARGHEIGLHASYTTMLDPEQARTELAALRTALDAEGIAADAVGSRQHFLRFSVPQTWRNLAEAGIAYDATLGFSEDVGFRAGTCHEYPVFDLERRTRLPLREQPLVVMEGAVLDRLQLGHDAAARTIADLRATCARYGGTFTLLWHNSRLVHRDDLRLYREVVGG